jgi:hypothetical protein
MAVQMVVCVPGTWKSPIELALGLVRDGAKWLLMANQLSEVATSFTCEIDFQEADPRMRDAFESSSGGRISASELKSIAASKSTVYLLGTAGDLPSALSFLRAANSLLEAGGLGVKIESSGVAHGPAK